MTEKKIYIDGEQTRRRLEQQAGSIKEACEKKGITSEGLNKICRDGCGTAKMINKYSEAGITFVYSNRPVPSRRRAEHTRGGASKVPEGEQIDLLTVYPKQFETIKNTEAKMMRDIIIKHLTALITELKDI